MRNFNESDYGLVELNSTEKNVLNGGVIAWLAVIGAGIYLYNNWDDFCAGFQAGYN